MTSLEWNKLAEEFGEQAYKRVCIRVPPNRFSFRNNSEVANCEEFEEIEMMPLTELFRLDVEVYGKNAYLMWEYYYSPSEEWITPQPQNGCALILMYLTEKARPNCRRKQ